MFLLKWIDRLYSDTGSVIKSLIRILFLFLVVLLFFVGIGIIIFGTVTAIETEDVIPFLKAFLVAIIGIPVLIILNYLSSLVLYSFGDLVDRTANIDKKMDSIIAMQLEEDDEEEDTSPKMPVLQPDEWCCPACHAIHKINFNFCGHCGQQKP